MNAKNKCSISNHDLVKEKEMKKESNYDTDSTVDGSFQKKNRNDESFEKENEMKKENIEVQASTGAESLNCNYALQKEQEMRKKKEDYKENMGFFSARWDSKLPEKEKTKFNLFTFAPSDTVAIRNEIVHYETFYKEAKELLNEITTNDPSNLREKIIHLKQKMSTQLLSAKTKKETTSSSVIHSLNESFIEDYHKLEYIVVVFENEALGNALIEMETRWKNAVTTIEELKGNLNEVKEKYDDVCNKYTEVCETLKKVEKDHATSLELQRQLKDDNKNMQNQLAEILKRLSKSSLQD